MNLKSIIKKSVLASMLAITTAAFGQKDILLYSTDFTDWTSLKASGTTSNAVNVSTGAGAGFILTQDATVDPTTGTYWIESTSGRSMTTKSFEFVSGGVVELTLEMTGSSSSRKFTIEGAAKCMVDEITASSGTDFSGLKIGDISLANSDKTLNTSLVGTWQNGSTVNLPKNMKGTVRVSLYCPTLAGANSVVITEMRQDVPVHGLKIYSSVGTTPYVCSSNYPDAGVDGTKTSAGLILKGDVDGAQVSGNVSVKGYNLTGDVTLSVIGQDAAKFTLGATTMSAADAMAGVDVSVNFTPSVKASAASAMLKISSATNDYYVNLLGATGSGNPQIVASTSLLNFWTSLIATTTQNLDVSGLNLTGPITATLEGAGASRFSLSTSEITLAAAIRGTVLDITFTGDIQESELPANLVLSSPGAPSVTVPLNGVTSLLRPVMYPLEFDVSPSGTAYIETNPGGTVFKEGTQVTVTVTLEKGYKISRWQDASGNTKSTRLFVVSESKNTMSGDPITVFTEIGQQSEGGDDPVEVSGLVALEASNVTADGLTANWTTQDGNANGYIVTVTDANGNVVATEQAASTSTSVAISGLEENTLYYYTVEGTGTEGTVTTEKVGGFRTLSTVVKECGSDDYND